MVGGRRPWWYDPSQGLGEYEPAVILDLYCCGDPAKLENLNKLNNTSCYIRTTPDKFSTDWKFVHGTAKLLVNRAKMLNGLCEESLVKFISWLKIRLVWFQVKVA